MNVDLSGETLELLPERAIHWAAQRMLIIADIHFGKAAAFRAGGIPVPHGTTAQNLALLEKLVVRHGAVHLMFLGDFLHAKASHAASTLDALRAWRARRPELELTLVRGNHDARAGDPPADLSISVVDEPHRIGPFAFCHHPQRIDGAYALAGHLHPVYRLAARGDMLRLPCFVIGPARGILPSFGAFTGGHAVEPHPGERLYMAADDAVFQVPEQLYESGTGQ